MYKIFEKYNLIHLGQCDFYHRTECVSCHYLPYLSQHRGHNREGAPMVRPIQFPQSPFFHILPRNSPGN